MFLFKRNKIYPPNTTVGKDALAIHDSTVDGDSEVTIVAPPVVPGRDPVCISLSSLPSLKISRPTIEVLPF